MHCSECDTAFYEDFPEQLAWHAARHDKVVHGLYTPRLKEDDLVWESGTHRIALVTDTSPMPAQEIAQEVGLLASQDSGLLCPFVAGLMPDEKRVHVFLYHAENRAVGFLMFRRREVISQMVWLESGKSLKCNKIESKEAIWTIGLVWVHSSIRRKRIARRLLRQAMQRLGVRIADIGWQPPYSDDGKSLIRALYPVSFLMGQ